MCKLRGKSLPSPTQVSRCSLPLEQSHNEVCTYSAVQPGSRKRKEREADMEDRLHRLELLLRAAAEAQSQNQTGTQSQTNGEGQNYTPSAPYTTLPTSQESLQQGPPKTRRLEAVNNKSPHTDLAGSIAPDGSTGRGPHSQGNDGNHEQVPPLPRETVPSQSDQEGSYNRILAVECDVTKVVTSSRPAAPPTRGAMQASVADGSDIFDSNPREDDVSTMRVDFPRVVFFVCFFVR
jgi:hypothetical protein